MLDIADVQESVCGPARYGVAARAKVAVANREQLRVYGPMGVMAARAPFPHRSVLEHKRPRLLSMAFAARLIQPRNRWPASRFHDVHPMRVMALHAVHFPFRYGVMLRQMKLGVDIQVALITRLWILPRIHDELVPTCASHGNVFAGRAMAGFAAVLAGRSGFFKPQPRVGAGGKCPGDVPMKLAPSIIGGTTTVRCTVEQELERKATAQSHAVKAMQPPTRRSFMFQ